MVEELLLIAVRIGDSEPNLLDVAAQSPLVRVGCSSLEKDLAVLVNAAIGWDVNQDGGWNEVEFELANLNWRIVQTVIGANTEGDVAFTLGVSSSVPFVDPILERVGLHRDLAVCTGDVRGVEPIS